MVKFQYSGDMGRGYIGILSTIPTTFLKSGITSKLKSLENQSTEPIHGGMLVLSLYRHDTNYIIMALLENEREKVPSGKGENRLCRDHPQVPQPLC